MIHPPMCDLNPSRPKKAGRALSVLLLLFALVACTEDPQRNEKDPRAAFPEPRFTAPEVPRVDEPADTWLEAACELPPDVFRRVRLGYQKGRSPDVLVVPRAPNFFGGFVSTGHSGPWDYLVDVPLVFYGPGFIRPVGTVSTQHVPTVADIAPTLEELLEIDIGAVQGKTLNEILVPEERRAAPPRLIVTVVWDGGGTNVLDAWPDFWPNLKRMMRRGASLKDAEVGSSPSITPSTHTTMGTGVFPNVHGISGISIRERGRITDSFKGKDADYVKVPMLADVYDVATDNASKVGLFAFKPWHLGMMSHGTRYPGGDKDIAIFLNPKEKFQTNRKVYSMPRYVETIPGLDEAIRKVDLDDGELDNSWMGHDENDLSTARERRDTPAWVLHQTTIIKELIQREGFGRDEVTDLFFTNYKQPDEAGHNYNMLEPEVAETIRYTDLALRDLENFLNQTVGKKQWVIVITADHGQQPDAEASRGWPITMSKLTGDLAEHFGVPEEELVFGSQGGMYIFKKAARENDITHEEVAEFLINYRIEDNIPPTRADEIPEQYHDRYDEPVFLAAFPASAMSQVAACVGNE